MAPEEIVIAGGLVLRRLQPDDAPRMLAAIRRSRPELKPYMPWAKEESTLETVGEYLERSWEPPQTFGFGLFDEAGEALGGFGLHARRGPGILEIGYWIRSDRTRRGYATAGAGALADASFEHFPDVDRVEIRCDPGNAASARVAAKLGFELTGEVPAEPASPSGLHQVWVTTRATWRPSAGRPAPPAAHTRPR